jgi:flagellin-like hook-associated protein FlgL
MINISSIAMGMNPASAVSRFKASAGVNHPAWRRESSVSGGTSSESSGSLSSSLEATSTDLKEAAQTASEGIGQLQDAANTLKTMDANYARMAELAETVHLDETSEEDRLAAREEFAELAAANAELADTLDTDGNRLFNNDPDEQGGCYEWQLGTRYTQGVSTDLGMDAETLTAPDLTDDAEADAQAIADARREVAAAKDQATSSLKDLRRQQMTVESMAADLADQADAVRSLEQAASAMTSLQQHFMTETTTALFAGGSPRNAFQLLS